MLEVRDLCVSYGRHRALAGVDLRVGKGEICVILGANGAGKSSLLKAIAGMVSVASGEVVMNGKTVTTMQAHQIVEEGIALVPEGRGIFGDLTVVENLQLGAFAARARNYEAVMLAEIYRLFPKLAERKDQIARTMSGGEQQMVAIGRALMSKPDILMLDEPSLGLSPILTQELFRSLAEVAKTGVGILLVEQNARQSLKISDRGYLIENGLVTGENTAEALMNNTAVINAYLGGGKAETEVQSGRKVILPGLPLGMDAMGRFIDELVERAGRIHRIFIETLRRKRSVPSAFVGLYDPDAALEPSSIVKTPKASAEAVALSLKAREFADCASQRLRLHILTQRQGSPVRVVENKEPENSLIGHNSRFALEDLVEAELPAVLTDQDRLNDGAEPPAVLTRMKGWPISDGIAALILDIRTRQADAVSHRMTSLSEKNQQEKLADWPVTRGLAALIAQAVESQAVSKQRTEHSVALSIKDDAAEQELRQNWPVSFSIAQMIAFAAARQSEQMMTERQEDENAVAEISQTAKKAKKAKKKEKRKQKKLLEE